MASVIFSVSSVLKPLAPSTGVIVRIFVGASAMSATTSRPDALMPPLPTRAMLSIFTMFNAMPTPTPTLELVVEALALMVASVRFAEWTDTAPLVSMSTSSNISARTLFFCMFSTNAPAPDTEFSAVSDFWRSFESFMISPPSMPPYLPARPPAPPSRLFACLSAPPSLLSPSSSPAAPPEAEAVATVFSASPPRALTVMSFVPLIDWFSLAFTLLLIQVTMNAPPTAVLPPADAASAVTR